MNFIMNTLDLKNNLIAQISKIDDVSFLKALKTIIEAKSKPLSSKENLYEEYNADILKAEEDISLGKTYSQNQVKHKVEQWKKK